MRDVILIRTGQSEKSIYGIISVRDGNQIVATWKTIERKEKSFPDGTYDLKFEHSPRFNTSLWELYGIHGRAEIKIHAANYYYQLDGCIGIGGNFVNIDGDDEIDVSESKKALSEFNLSLIKQKESTIKIVTI